MVRFDEDEIKVQKSCVPGPRVKFRAGLPMYAYLEDVEGLCPSSKYPKYEAGKYCCVSEPPSPQEVIDYVHVMLERAFENNGPTSFSSTARAMEYLLKKRAELLLTFPGVQDTLVLPEGYTSVETLFKDRFEESNTKAGELPQGNPLLKRPLQERVQLAIARGEQQQKKFGGNHRHDHRVSNSHCRSRLQQLDMAGSRHRRTRHRGGRR
jgi:hypothetical protein